MKTPDITINVTAHNEDLLLHKTLRSVMRCYEYVVSNKNIHIEFNLSLDKPSGLTKRIANEFEAKHGFIKIHHVSFGDLAEHRNYLISKSSGKYIAFFDGDDLFTENYLLEAYGLSENSKLKAVYSPEFLVSFGEQEYITKKLDFNNPNFHRINMFEYNYFISQSFAEKSIFESNLYRPNKDGYGMEDWDWNNRAIAKGISFINIPNTIFFYRRKENSMVKTQTTQKATLRPSEFFTPKFFKILKTYKTNSHETEQTNNNAGKSIAKLASLGSDTVYEFIRGQYLLNKQFTKDFIAVSKNRLHIKNAYSNIVSNQNILATKISDKAIREWKKINSIEPMIRPSNSNLNNILVTNYADNSPVSLLYHKLCKDYGDFDFEDMVLVPHLIKGGADSAAVNLIKSMARQKSSNIFVFSTVNVDSPWSKRISSIENVKYINIKRYLSEIDDDLIKIFITRIIQNWGIKRLNIINSKLGYELVKEYGSVIRQVAKVYVHTYAFDTDEEGLIYNYISNGLVDIYNYVDLYITDSQKYKTELIEINGFEENKIKTLYLPAKLPLKPVIYQPKRKNKVLWASRVSSAKLVEVAARVGEELGKHNIELHFYGELDVEYNKDNYFINLIKPFGNIFYHGSYDDFYSIPVSDYDLMLFTSKNEGMPNAVIEALISNLFVVAPEVGGIPELIKDGINGYLVKDKLIADEYISKILEFYSQPIDEDKKTNLNKTIAQKHSQSSYNKNVKNIFYPTEQSN